MKTYAVYRCLYGDDFVKYSIESVLDHVDEVFVIYGERPFGNVTECEYQGKTYTCPQKFDRLLECIPEVPKVHMIPHYYATPRNQWTRIMNELIAPVWDMPDVMLCMHVGMVWRPEELESALEQFRKERWQYASSRQVELWRGFDWRIPERLRAGAGFVNLRGKSEMPRTGLDPWVCAMPGVPLLDAHVHNFRYAQNPNIMFWRHVVVSEYVKRTGDSTPDPRHFEDKWLNWTPETRDIEMALNWRHTVPKAVPYAIDLLPQSIQDDIAELRAQTANAAWKGFPQCE